MKVLNTQLFSRIIYIIMFIIVDILENQINFQA